MRKLSLSRKGQVNTLAPAILALVFAAIVLVFGVIMSQELRDTQIGTSTSGTIANESFNPTGAGILDIAFLNACGFASWNASAIINQSILSGVSSQNNTLLEGTDYVINGNGTLTNLTGWNISIGTYTYQWGDEACIGANLTIVGLGSFADFWEIIVLAIVITIVIGLLLIVFGGRRQR